MAENFWSALYTATKEEIGGVQGLPDQQAVSLIIERVVNRVFPDPEDDFFRVQGIGESDPQGETTADTRVFALAVHIGNLMAWRHAISLFDRVKPNQ